MSKVFISEVSRETGLLDLPYEVLCEILSSLPKNKLIKISRLHPKLRDIAGDTRFWKDTYIKYKPYEMPHGEKTNEIFAFEELYSEPWPVKVIDLSDTKINPPVSSRIGQVIKVTRLNMTSIIANKVTMEAILAKYQCIELNLESCSRHHDQDHVTKIAPEAFQNQAYLEVLSISGHRSATSALEKQVDWNQWLTQVLSNFKILKTLDLSALELSNDEMMGLVKNLPTSLDKLLFLSYWVNDDFYKLLAERIPNLKEVEVLSLNLSYPSLFKFKQLEALHITPIYYNSDENFDMYRSLITFPALKTIHIEPDAFRKETTFEKFRTALESNGIRIVIGQRIAGPGSRNLADRNFWLVSNLV